MGISNKVFGVVKEVIFKRDSMIVVEYDGRTLIHHPE